MNAIWTALIFFSTLALTFFCPDGAITALVAGAKNSVDLALSLVATYGFWLGFFALLEKSGASTLVEKLLSPLISWLFPGISKESKKFVSMNMSANLLGLGNASTPMGINAINSMNEGKNYASTNMIMLTVISATSLQLIPSTVIGLRVSHGSLSPASFLIPSIVATVVSTVVGVLLVKILSKILPKEPSSLPLKMKMRGHAK